jgi:hypothetical protein
MSDFDRIVEKIIREAQQEGKLDPASGQGRKLNLDPDGADSHEWTAHHALENAGFRPDWLEEDVAIRDELAAARDAVRRSHEWRAAELAGLGARTDLEAERRRQWVDGEWLLALGRFRDTVAALNPRIRRLNLKVPSERFQRFVIDAEAEIDKLKDPPASQA